MLTFSQSHTSIKIWKQYESQRQKPYFWLHELCHNVYLLVLHFQNSKLQQCVKLNVSVQLLKDILHAIGQSAIKLVFMIKRSNFQLIYKLHIRSLNSYKLMTTIISKGRRYNAYAMLLCDVLSYTFSSPRYEHSSQPISGCFSHFLRKNSEISQNISS